MRSLDAYLEKRDFDLTPEPKGRGAAQGLALRYSMQKHDASALHFDLRLEWDGVLLSWAVTKGPSYDPSDKRLAVRTEDHPVDYLDFEGTIPKEEYGGGTVMLWDIGHWRPDGGDAQYGLKKGHLRLTLYGRRNTGAWDLVRMGGKAAKEKRENWLLIKVDDEAARDVDPVKRYTTSVATHRTMAMIANDKPARDFGPKREGAAPRFKKPQLATLADGLDEGRGDERWHELKFDGYRAIATLGKGGVRLFTRNGHDWSEKFAPLVPALAELKADTAMIDGEIVAGAGLTGFSALQDAISEGGPFTFFAFDLLRVDGEDLTGEPLSARRKRLDALLSGVPPLGLVQTSPIIRGAPDEAFAAICEAGGEGLIAKRTDAPYRSGRSRAWLKIKCEHRAEFAVVGWTKSDKAGRPFSSLVVASAEGDGLTYRGKVGTGFDGKTLERLSDALSRIERKSAPLTVPRSETRGVTWVTPKLVAEVSYAEMTGDGRLRHGVFHGLREDKSAQETSLRAERGNAQETSLRAERGSAQHTSLRDGRGDADDPSGGNGSRRDASADTHDGDALRIAGVRVSSPGRVVYPKAKLTKGDVARYCADMAERILAVAADRPLSLVRLPEGLAGERFFQKHAGKGFPDAIGTVKVTERNGDVEDYMMVRDAAGLVGAAQMGTLEFHIWGARRDRLERPDRMVFDLDPDERLAFDTIAGAARDLRDTLAQLGLASAAMVTGGKGVHVVVPLRRSVSWDTVKTFAQTLAKVLAEREPERFTAKMAKASRKGRIFIDWLRNERGATAIAPFSPRAREGAPVAVPVTWDELASLKRADAFSLDAARERTWSDAPLPDDQRITNKTADALARLHEG